jgi:hypothetical protein
MRAQLRDDRSWRERQRQRSEERQRRQAGSP